MDMKGMDLALLGEATARLKWTPELHRKFVDAIEQLGGAERATPKSLMKMMGVQGLTLHHLKSHLQKHRLGKSQACNQNNQEEDSKYSEKDEKGSHEEDKDETYKSLQITQALAMQMKVESELHEQREAQRQLQLRIEAQGKYLQSLLKKALETLSQQSFTSIEAEHAKAQLSLLLSFSVLRQSEQNGGSQESSIAASESSLRTEDSRQRIELGLELKPVKRKNKSETTRLMQGVDLNNEFLNHARLKSEDIDLNR